MLTVIVTGGIGSGKSAVCALLRERGIPVYDCDSRVKELYSCRRSLVPKLEKTLGSPLRRADGTLDKIRLAAIIFSDPAARETLESIVYPILLQDFKRWRSHQKAPFVALESAIILSKPLFDGLADVVVLVEAPQELRISRVMARDGSTREEVLRRMKAQCNPEGKTEYIRLDNSGDAEELSDKVDQLFFDKNGYICKLVTFAHSEPEG